MNLYTSLTLRYLKENKKRTIVTIIGIILSTALICGIGNIYESFMDYQIRETVSRNGDFHATFYDVKSEELGKVSKSAGVSRSGYSKTLGHANISEKSLIQIKYYDKNAFDGYQISLKEGKLPTNDKEIVISEDALNLSNKKVGDYLTLKIGDRVSSDDQYEPGTYYDAEKEKIVNTKEKKYKVVGIINRPSFEYGNDIVSGITYLDINSLPKNEKINVSIAVNNPKEVYEIVPSICKNLNLKSTNEVTEEDLTEDNGMHYNNDTGTYYENVSFNEHLLRLQGASKYANVNDSLTKLLALVTSLVVICTIATVYNAFSISISERKKQFGILNSIGATKSQVMKLVFIEAVLVSIIGIPIGILSGTVAMDIVFKVVNKLFANSFIAEMDLRVVYNPYIIILSIVIVLFTIIISAILPAMSAAKISPLEAIKNSSNLKVGKVKDSKIVRVLFKTEGVLAYKNLRRNKNKFRITLFSLIVSVVIFISFSGFMGLFVKSNEIHMGMMNFDFSLYLKGENSVKFNDEVINEMKKINGINKFAIDDTFYLSTYVKENKVNKEYLNLVQQRYESKTQDNEKVYEFLNDNLLMPGEDAIKDLKLLEGSFDKENAIKENGVILVNKSYYEEPGKKGEIRLTDYKVGDEIEIYEDQYDEEGNVTSRTSKKLKILAITEELLTGRQYNSMGLDFITYGEVAKNLGFEPYQNNIYISTDKEENTRNTLKEFADKYDFGYSDEFEYAKEAEESNMAIQVFVYGFITVISLVSVTNIVNTISTNINLRKKELAIIKSIGVTPGGFNKMIYLESLLYGVLALMYGVPMGLGLVYLMNTILGDVIMMGFVIPWDAVIICVIGLFMITFISAYIPMKKLNKENIIENIRQESI